jgi:DNA-binding winged helix-turn-helix (wHTH) protein
MSSRCANHEQRVRTQTFRFQQVAARDGWEFTCMIRLLPRSGILSRAPTLTMTGTREVFCFGEFELDVDAGELRRKDRRLKLQPQPFKLLVLLVRKSGALVTREEIRRELWPDGTFVDFDQSVNFSIKQIRDALGDEADRPLYIETVPRRGHRFIAPISTPGQPQPRHSVFPMGATGIRLEKALWTNIAELRLAENRRRRQMWIAITILSALLAAAAILLLLRH